MIVQSIINRALRRLGTLGAGATPRDVENQDALDTLRSLYQRWITEGAFGALRDVTPIGDYVAHENERIFRNSASTANITLPESVANYPSQAMVGDYGAGWYSGPIIAGINTPTRLPRDGSVVVIIDAFTAPTETWIYDGHLKRWCDVTNLDFGAIAPLSERDSSGLAACLAVELADEFGQSVPPLTVNSAQRFQMGLTHNYSVAGDVVTPTSFI
jgi:hypothetical protein